MSVASGALSSSDRADGQPEPVRAAASPPVVTMRGASRRFHGETVLEDIDLDVGAGELFGLVGPSGCGKTTLVRLLVGLLLPSEGEVLVRGREPRRFRPRDRRAIGYLPQVFSLYPTLTVEENARFVAGLYGIGPWNRGKRIHYVLDLLGLWEARKRLGADLSGGMQRRLGLACSVLHRPSLLVVDEPTAGLDPTLRARIWEYLHQLQRDGTTIFLTTQYIEEAEHCDSVAVMREGRAIAVGSPATLRRQASIPDTLEVRVEGMTPDDVQALWPLPGVREVRRMGDGHVRILAEESDRVLPQITEEFVRRGRRVNSVETSKASFEEVYLRLVERVRR